MVNKKYYIQALGLIEESVGLYENNKADGLLNELWVDLARYAFLSDEIGKARRYTKEAIDFSTANAALLLTDADLSKFHDIISKIIKAKTNENYSQCNEVLAEWSVEHFHIPNKDEQSELVDRALKVENLIRENSLIASEKAVLYANLIKNIIIERKYITEEAHRKKEERKKKRKEKERQRKEEERQLAEEEERINRLKAEERAKRNQQLLEEEERKRELEKERREAVTYAAHLKRKKLKRRSMIIIGIVLIVFCYWILYAYNNRSRYTLVDTSSFLSNLGAPDEKFTSYYFIFKDDMIMHIKAIPGRSIRVPKNTDFEAEDLNLKWSSKINEFSVVSNEAFIPFSDSENQTVDLESGEKIIMGPSQKFYFAFHSPLSLIVKLEGNGVDTIEKHIKVASDSDFILPEPSGPIPENLSFAGWSESKYVIPETPYKSGESIKIKNEDKTFYALWSLEKPSIFQSLMAALTFPTTIYLAIPITFITSRILILRFILVVTCFLQTMIAGWSFNNYHKFSGFLFSYLALTSLIWVVLPRFYYMALFV